MVVYADGSATLLPQTDGIALGVLPGVRFESHTVTLQAGDTVLLYTDGVTEAQNPNGEQYGLQRLRELYREGAPTGAEAATAGIFRAVRGFAGTAPQFDDITCLALCQRG